jgi:hypothetical protein
MLQKKQRDKQSQTQRSRIGTRGLFIVAVGLGLSVLFTNLSLLGTHSWNGYTAYYYDNGWIWGGYDVDRRHQLTEFDPKGRHANLCVPTGLNNLLQGQLRRGKTFAAATPFLQDSVRSTSILADWMDTNSTSGTPMTNFRNVFGWFGAVSGQNAINLGLRNGTSFTPFNLAHITNSGITGMVWVGSYQMQARPAFWGGFVIALQRQPVGHVMTINAQYSDWSRIWRDQFADPWSAVYAMNAFNSTSGSEVVARTVSVDWAVASLANRRPDLWFWGVGSSSSNALLYSQEDPATRFFLLDQNLPISAHNNEILKVVEGFSALY